MRRLSDHLVAETEYLWANVGAGVTEAGVVLIDCPVRPSDSRSWQEKLRALSPKGIRYRISTDYHGDHTIGAAFIEDEGSSPSRRSAYTMRSPRRKALSPDARPSSTP